MRAVADLIDRTMYELVLYRMNDQLPNDDGIPALNRLLVTDLTAAVLGVFPGPASVQLAALSRSGVPVAVIDDQYDPMALDWGDLPVPWITCENKQGAYEAVRHLIGHGHRRIAHIQGPLRWICARERQEGYCQAMEEAGLPVDPLLVCEGDFTTATGVTAAEQLFSLPKAQRPTAIFVSSDLMAYGVLSAARKYDVSIPDDIALVGFDDLDGMAESPVVIAPGELRLTTIRQPFFEMGQYALELLFALLEVPSAAGYHTERWSFLPESLAVFKEAAQSQKGIARLRLPTTLTVRESCGCNNSAVLADEALAL
jgi:LacI family transcriptional regulator